MKKIYYIIKPFIPRRIQLFLRRMLIRLEIKKHTDVWPIFPGSQTKPKNWTGWPDGKKFALVLTHDVEHQSGHDKCEELLKVEKNIGFKSSFNFVPERYNVSNGLRKYIVDNNFEVGVHGLNHDGKLFRDKKIFSERAKKINQYLKGWNSVGFRAPAMHHNLDWLKELNIEYDLSTFDTDPFEPQSDGVGTIFPFIVERENNKANYVELPYTLVQDFTLFILMREKNIKIWQKKIDWVVNKGGMILVNVHPDYINFKNSPIGPEEYSVELYIDVLNYIKEKYVDEYWNVLPKDVARYYKRTITIN